MSNTITAYFKGRVGVAESVYQNDYGIVMEFDRIVLPTHFDCYFSKLNQEEAVPAIGADNRVVIPNSILADPGNMTIHIPLHTGESDSEVEYVIYFKVIGRARPIDDGAPAQMTAVERALALLSQPITNIEEIVNESLSFTGDTFDEMQAALDDWKDDTEDDLDDWKTGVEGGLATWKTGVETDFDVLQGQFDTAVASVTTDTEVTDIRVGDDGVTYNTAGNAVRTQFSNVKSDINNNINFVQNEVSELSVAWENGQISGGQPAAGAYNQRTKNFIDVSLIGYQNVVVANSKSDITAYICQYSADKTYLGYVTIPTVGEASPTAAGTVFIKVTTYSTDTAQESQHNYITIRTENRKATSLLSSKIDRLEDTSFDESTIDYASHKSAWEDGCLSENGQVLSTSTFKTSGFIELLPNSAIRYKTTLYTNVYYVAFYDETKAYIANSAIKAISGNNWANPYTVGSLTIPSGARYFRMTFRADNDALYGEQFVAVNNSKIAEIEERYLKPTARVLIIGNSYSANNVNWIAPMMEHFSRCSSFISLAVSSATVKDQNNDRTAYPYTSRPLSTNTEPNTNTFGCQIAKLKRLIEGVDLDEGETAIYQNESEYPNVIIIQGGENDWKDGSTSNYISQYEVAEENAYYSMWGSVSQGTVYLKPDIETIDRTIFAGAYRYVVEELYNLFPKAQFFITTTAPCAPHRNPVASLRREVAEQQRLCADLCCASVIDWQAESQISIVTNSVTSGNGTQDNPYNVTPNTADLSDGLHPTAYGGKKLGKLAGAIVSHKFMGLS